MIIRMTNLKSLVISEDSKLYQRENIVDKFLILLPLTYNDLDLSKFTVTWEYVDPQNEAHSEQLVLGEDIYKEKYLQYTLPIDSKMTYFQGNITAKISAVCVDLDNPDKRYVLHTGEIVIPISPLSDYYALVSDDTLSAIDERMLNLNAQIGALDILAQEISGKMVDDLSLDEDSVLRVSSGGVPIGNGIEIVSGVKDPDGNPADGLIDLDETIDVDLPEESVPIIDLGG